MPVPLKVNWDLAKALFLQGVSDKVIAAKIGIKPGTLRCRASRHEWCSQRDMAAEIVQREVGKVAVRDLSSIAKEIRDTLADDALRSAKALSNKDPSRMSLDNLEIRERTAQSLTRRAWQTLGLDQQGAGGVVNVNLLAQFSIDEAHSGHTLEVTDSEPTLIKDTLNHSLPEAGPET